MHCCLLLQKTQKHLLQCFVCFLCMYAGKPNLRLPLNDQTVIHEECSPSPAPSSGASSQSTLTCPQSPQSDTFHWPDVQNLRTKYTSCSSKVTASCSVPNGMMECCTDRCNSCSHKYNSSADLHKALADSHTTQTDKDWPETQTRLQPLLCRWSSLDHMLGSLSLHEVQNLQEPVRTFYTGSQMSLITRETSKLQDEDKVLQEGSDCSAKSSSLKMTESNLVKSLREKFQSLSTSSWSMYIFIIRDYHMETSASYLPCSVFALKRMQLVVCTLFLTEWHSYTMKGISQVIGEGHKGTAYCFWKIVFICIFGILSAL